jgi:hypothetical protein
MTNADVSGRSAEAIEEMFAAVGIKKLVILGRERISQMVNLNATLRLSVPRMYTLADLTSALDARAYEQARAVVESMRIDLERFVVTETYRKAVRTLTDFGLIVLVGEPASGKSTTAAALAAGSIDLWDLAPLKANSAEAFVRHWDVADSRTFFWVDDAFGSQQFRVELVDEWNRVLPEVVAAARRGSRLVLTTRDYIWNDAKRGFKAVSSRLIASDVVAIDLAAMTSAERELILYNHLKLGDQPRHFKTSVKPFLTRAASSAHFLPETARRFSDPAFTSQLRITASGVLDFFDRPIDYLTAVIAELDAASRASLGLLFAMGGRLELPLRLRREHRDLLNGLGGEISTLGTSLRALNESLVRFVHSPIPTTDGISKPAAWMFRHPTIADAVGRFLASDPEYLELYVELGGLEELLSMIEAGPVGITGAIRVGRDYFPSLANRIAQVDQGARSAVTAFLSRRSSDEFLRYYIDVHGAPEWVTPFNTEGVSLLVRLDAADALPDAVRDRVAEDVESEIETTFSMDLLTDPGIKQVLGETRLAGAYDVARQQLEQFDDVLWNLEANYDEREDPEAYVDATRYSLQTLSAELGDDPAQQLIDYCLNRLDDLEEQLKEKVEDEDEEAWRQAWSFHRNDERDEERSIFDDVDD